MKKKRIFTLFVLVMLFAIITVGIVSADDGEMLIRNVSKTPDTETADAQMSMMQFYVPAQSSAGELVIIDYNAADGSDIYERDMAKPLFFAYIDGIEEEDHEASIMSGGAGGGQHDAFVALSLDDGMTWKRANVSNSAHLSSFTLHDGDDYPGDTTTMAHAVAGDKVFAAWISKYCAGGTPAYAMLDEENNPVYPDLFGVAGAQKSVDYTEQGHPDVGEVPYGCVWTSRGQLLADPEAGLYDVVWTKAERLTSGRRDPNRLEVAAVADAGFMMVWQEDPEGLRPGTGEGPGEGWSGAIANAKTDVWYSYVSWADYDQVWEAEDSDVVVALADYAGDTAAKVAFPMSVPVRVTDNNMCRPQANENTDNPSAPYCYVDFSNVDADGNLILPDDLPTSADENSTNCVDTVSSTNNQGVEQTVCVTEDGRVLAGRVAATRPRIALHGYDQDGDGVNDSAWVVLGYEETKALGESTLETEDDSIVDEGKNLWYHSFDMFNADIVSHGNILNQPAKDPLTGEFFDLLNTDDDGNLGYGEYAYDFYETEISRRFSLISQDAADAGGAGVVAFTLVKQGIIKQGGPADIFAQRIVYMATDPTADDILYSLSIPENCSGISEVDEVDGDDDETLPNIGGIIEDENGDGLACVSLDLLNADDVILATVFTNGDGNYVFRDVKPGVPDDPDTVDVDEAAPLDYTVQVTDSESHLANYTPALPVEEDVSMLDVDILDVDFQFTFESGVECSGIAYLDGDQVDHSAVSDIEGLVTDDNGVGLACVSVDLIEDGLVVASLYTASDGSYEFQDVGVGDFSVEITDDLNILALYVPVDATSVPVDIDAENPYAYENMDCPDDPAVEDDGWAFRGENGEVLTPDDPDYNPFYPKGVCLSNPPNLSGTVAEDCEGSTCPTVLDIYTCDETGACDFDLSDYGRVTEWSQCGPDYGGAFNACAEEDNNLDDASWENPYDIAKGHRGFMDGDFIQVLYAWSPNYKHNAVGHDHYNLYVRRSFDGGITWSTTPASFTHTDGVTYTGEGTEFYENFGWGSGLITPFLYDLGAGEFEPARNVSQLIGSRETILDPRYSPTPGSITQDDGSFLYPDDERDPSKFFIVYETGDNTTVITGEATPLDLFYSRATNWGDFYDEVVYNNDADGDGDLDVGWDWLEKGDAESGEASITCNPGGTFFYAAWNEALEIGEEEFTDMDAIFRRVTYIDDPNADAAPSTAIVYVSSIRPQYGDELVLVGSAWDNDHVDGMPLEDIAEVVWTDTFDGVETVIDDGDADPKRLNIPVSNLQPGWHEFGFKASDKGGKWSPGVKVGIMVYEVRYDMMLPAVVNP